MKLRTISYISAWLQIAICVIIILYFAVSLATHDLEVDEDDLDPLLLIFLIIIVVSVPFLIALLVGIKQHRMILVGVFLYAAHTLLVVGIIYMVYEFIMGFVHKVDLGEIFIHLIIEGTIIGLEFLLTAPIHMLYKRRNIPAADDARSSIKEPCGPSATKSVRKVSYVA